MSAPGEAALTSYLQASQQYSLDTTYSGNSYNLKLSRVPNSGTTTFNGSAPAYSTVQTVSLFENGTLVANDISTAYYLLSPYVPLGRVSSSGSPYAVVTSSFPLPTTINVGDSGAYENMTYYHDSTMATMDADETATYSVSANNATTVLLCVNATVSNVTAQGAADGMGDSTESDCYTVSGSGAVALVSVTVTVNGVTLKFQ